jgi:hypothetical protein
MNYGSFTDMYRNEISLYPSSNVKGGIWLRIKDKEGLDKASHLSVEDAKLLIAILEKAIKHQLEQND